MVSCRDVPQYKVMKYLVFGIISNSLLSELQDMIPKVDHNGVAVLYILRYGLEALLNLSMARP